MGYRQYINFIKKDKLKELFDLHLSSYDFEEKIQSNSIYYVQIELDCIIESDLRSNAIFLNPNDCDTPIMYCGNDICLKIANFYKQKVLDSYKNIYELLKKLEDNELDNEDKFQLKIISQQVKWNIICMKDIMFKETNSFEGDFNSGSSLYEHEMFKLIAYNRWLKEHNEYVPIFTAH